MELKKISKEEFYRAVGKIRRGRGRNQQIIEEFLESDADYAEIFGDCIKAAHRATSVSASCRRMRVNCYAISCGERVFLIRGQRVAE